MISIILIEPETGGNVGAIARAMKNFDLDNLIIINPQCDPLGKEAMDRATHAKEILKKAKIVKKFNSKFKKQFDYLVATTARLGSDYNIPRCPLTPEQFAEKINELDPKKTKIGLLIGREGIGLKNDEIEMCDFVVSIPTSIKMPTMNVSHAATIIFYELFKKSKNKKILDHIAPMSNKEKEVILNLIDKALDKMHFATKEKKETQRIVWKKLIGKSMMTRREAFALCGFFRKL